MGKHFKTFLHILIAASMLPFAAALTSCSHDNPDDPSDFNVHLFSVSGTVYDSSLSLPGVPLEDITVTLSAYWYFDTDREEAPIYVSVLKTGADGKYQFTKSWNMTMQNVFYVLNVTDESKLRTVHFKSVEQELYLRSHTDTYDNVMRSYEVRDNDFYLTPESL